MSSSIEGRLAATVHADVEGHSRHMAFDEESTVRAVGALRVSFEEAVRLLAIVPTFRLSLMEQFAPAQPRILPRTRNALRKAGAPE